MQRPDPTPDTPTESQPPRRRRAWLWWTIGIIGGFFVLILTIGALVGSGDADNSQTSAASSPTTQPVIVPTETPAPAATSVVECPTQAERAYMLELATATSPLQKSMSDFTTLNSQLSQNALLLFDENWKWDMIIALAVMQTEAQALADVKAPPSMVYVQQDMVNVAASMKQMTEAYAQGIDNLNEDDLYVALAHLENINATVALASSKIDNHCK